MAEKYQYRSTYHGPKKVPAEVAGAVFGRLADENDLRPSRVLAEATPEEAPLHDEFTWGDEAAHKWRLHEARVLIRSIVVVPIPEESEDAGTTTLPESAFIHVPSRTVDEEHGREGRYMRPEDLVKNEDDYSRAYAEIQKLADALERELNQLRRLAEDTGSKDLQAAAMAIQGFAVVREALSLLRH